MQAWPRSVLVDAGPLVALGRARDADSQRARQFAASFNGVLVTTMPVIAEACHFVREKKIDLFKQIGIGTILIEDIGASDMPRLIEFCVKYPQADFADASLIVIAERLGIMHIATIDEMDFSVYRTKTGKHFTNVF